MKRLILFILLFAPALCTSLYAQLVPPLREDTLPKFSLKNAGNNRVIIGWVNNFPNIRQISIQRSFDSLTGYKTILTVPDPTTPQNGYVDAKATNDHMFYRLYIMLEKGIFMFSDSRRPKFDTVSLSDSKRPMLDSVRRANFPDRITILPNIDSVAVPNVNNNKPKPYVFLPSLYVYTNRDGYVRISLPDEEKPKKYSIKFFEENETFLFELKEIKEKNFKIDKTNFYHAGWFRFELYADGKLLEKHKFYLEKDF